MSELGFSIGGFSANVSYEPPFDAKIEIERLVNEIMELSEVGAMMQMPGWKHTCRWAEGTVREYDRQIVALSTDLEKNKKKIEVRKNLRDMLDSFMRGVNGRVSTLSGKQQELEVLQGAAVELSPQG